MKEIKILTCSDCPFMRTDCDDRGDILYYLCGHHLSHGGSIEIDSINCGCPLPNSGSRSLLERVDELEKIVSRLEGYEERT